MNWIAIPGYDGYFISDDYKLVKGKRGLLSLINNDGRFHTSLRRNGKGRTLYLHQIVWITFVDPTYEPSGNKIVIDHKDNERRFDNSPSNLQLLYNRDNSLKDLPNKLKYTGAYKYKDKWRAKIVHNGKQIYLKDENGSALCNTPEEAYQRYLLYKKEIEPPFSDDSIL
jgi:hypothetical protein